MKVAAVVKGLTTRTPAIIVRIRVDWQSIMTGKMVK
jgi:hypothetical protein